MEWHEIISSRDIERQLRGVGLVLDSNCKPYKNATIAWREFDPQELWPASLYLIKELLEYYQELRKLISEKQKIDILNLDFGIKYSINGGTYVMIPPIVEESAADDNKKVILDGLHRIFLSRKTGKIRCLYITHIDPHWPPPGLPNPRGWEEVKIVEKAPPHNQKKYYRSPMQRNGLLGMDTRRDLSVLGIGGGKTIRI